MSFSSAPPIFLVAAPGRPTLSVLEQYTKIHFETEEELMKLHGFRDLDATIVLDFLKDWWLDHINKQDWKFAEHLRHAGAL